jgi:4-aminobutyrate aminotransferase-like enzyme
MYKCSGSGTVESNVGITDAGYGIRTERSREIFERLERSIPGGNTRSLAYFPPYPLVISSGSGCRIGDADGNEFIDLLNNYTASVHGHALPAINEAMSKQAALGTVFPAPSELQAELAERIVGRVASVEKVRFANSGTEAVMMAVRGGRAFTGREKIVKAEGGYNDMWEQVPVSWPKDPYRAAMPEGVRELVRMVDYNDVGQLGAAMEDDEVAAIILEPVTGTGVFAGTREYFAAARRLAEEVLGEVHDPHQPKAPWRQGLLSARGQQPGEILLPPEDAEFDPHPSVDGALLREGGAGHAGALASGRGRKVGSGCREIFPP